MITPDPGCGSQAGCESWCSNRGYKRNHRWRGAANRQIIAGRRLIVLSNCGVESGLRLRSEGMATAE